MSLNLENCVSTVTHGSWRYKSHGKNKKSEKCYCPVTLHERSLSIMYVHLIISDYISPHKSSLMSTGLALLAHPYSRSCCHKCICIYSGCLLFWLFVSEPIKSLSSGAFVSQTPSNKKTTHSESSQSFSPHLAVFVDLRLLAVKKKANDKGFQPMTASNVSAISH